MRLRVALLHWIVCVGVFALLVIFANTWLPSIFVNLSIFFCIAAGIYLNRKVLGKIVEWHPMYDTLEGVASDKLRFFIFWPVSYLALFSRIIVNRVL